VVSVGSTESAPKSRPSFDRGAAPGISRNSSGVAKLFSRVGESPGSLVGGESDSHVSSLSQESPKASSQIESGWSYCSLATQVT
jgi:hypothetical protein